MFGEQTPSNIVRRPNISPFGHLVWCCLIVFDRVWSCFESHRIFDQKLKTIFFVLLFDGRCFVRLDSRVSNMFDTGMRSTLARRLVSID